MFFNEKGQVFSFFMIFLRDLLGCVLGDVCAKLQKELVEGGVLKSILGSFCTRNAYI